MRPRLRHIGGPAWAFNLPQRSFQVNGKTWHWWMRRRSAARTAERCPWKARECKSLGRFGLLRCAFAAEFFLTDGQDGLERRDGHFVLRLAGGVFFAVLGDHAVQESKQVARDA